MSSFCRLPETFQTYSPAHWMCAAAEHRHRYLEWCASLSHVRISALGQLHSCKHGQVNSTVYLVIVALMTEITDIIITLPHSITVCLDILHYWGAWQLDLKQGCRHSHKSCYLEFLTVCKLLPGWADFGVLSAAMYSPAEVNKFAPNTS